MWNLKVIYLFLFCACLISQAPVFGAEGATLQSGKTFDVSKSFERISIVQGNVSYEVGNHIKLSSNVQQVWVMWSGKSKKDVVKTVTLHVGEKTQTLVAEKTYLYEEGAAILYMAYAKVRLNDKKGELKFLTKKNSTHDFFGHAFVVVKKDIHGKTQKIIGIYGGLMNLKPGEIYHVQLPIEAKGLLTKASVIGGGGLEGNGSTNMVQGVSLSGGDDWNGSSGPKWDVDTYEDLKKYHLNIDRKITFSIDPLLQWVFPSMFIVEVQKRGGE